MLEQAGKPDASVKAGQAQTFYSWTQSFLFQTSSFSRPLDGGTQRSCALLACPIEAFPSRLRTLPATVYGREERERWGRSEGGADEVAGE